MTKRYVLHPGYVRSKNDGDIHYINAWQLAQLYGVSMDECVLFMPDRGQNLEGLISLGPRDSGNYSLPTKPTPR